MGYQTEAEQVQAIVEALATAAREHGAPNSFSPKELTQLYGCQVSCLRIGQLAQRNSRIIYEQLALRGLISHYAEQRFQLTPTPVQMPGAQAK